MCGSARSARQPRRAEKGSRTWPDLMPGPGGGQASPVPKPGLVTPPGSFARHRREAVPGPWHQPPRPGARGGAAQGREEIATGTRSRNPPRASRCLRHGPWPRSRGGPPRAAAVPPNHSGGRCRRGRRGPLRFTQGVVRNPELTGPFRSRRSSCGSRQSQRRSWAKSTSFGLRFHSTSRGDG